MRISGSTTDINSLVWTGTREEVPSILRDIADHSYNYGRPIEDMHFYYRGYNVAQFEVRFQEGEY